MKKKIVALLLIASMAATALVGCGEDAKTTSSSEESKTTSNSEESKTAESEAVDDGALKSELATFNETGYPVVDEPITLTVLMPVATERAGDVPTNAALLKFQEVTGVKLDFITVPSGEWNEELSLILASDELPDVIAGSMGMQDLSDSIKAKTIIDLKPYIEAYGTNVKAYMEAIEGAEATITLPTGEIPCLPYTNMTTETGKCPNAMLYVYQPWMDKLGLKTPTTAEELYDVLVAFKTKDPNGNGQADEIPFLPRNLNNFYELFGMFGVIVQQGNYLQEMDDKIVFTPSTQNFKDGLIYLAKLYQEGLVNPDVFTDGNAQTLAKGSGEVELAGSILSAAQFASVGEERDDDMTLVTDIAAEGYEMKWLNRQAVVPGRFMITSECEYPEVALRVWDYMFSQEGASLLWMGVEDNYTWNADKTSWSWNLAEGQTVENIRATKTIQTTCSFAAAYCYDWFKQDAGAETLANRDRVILGTQYADKLDRPIPDGLQYDKETSEERNLLLTDLNNYVNTAIAQFITGELSIEKDWDTFIKQCETYKVNDILAMTQTAYDTYKASLAE